MERNWFSPRSYYKHPTSRQTTLSSCNVPRASIHILPSTSNSFPGVPVLPSIPPHTQFQASETALHSNPDIPRPKRNLFKASFQNFEATNLDRLFLHPLVTHSKHSPLSSFLVECNLPQHFPFIIFLRPPPPPMPVGTYIVKSNSISELNKWSPAMIPLHVSATNIRSEHNALSIYLLLN